MDVFKSFAEDIKAVEENIDSADSIYQSVLLSRELDAFQSRVGSGEERLIVDSPAPLDF